MTAIAGDLRDFVGEFARWAMANDVQLLRPVARAALRGLFVELHHAAVRDDGREAAQLMKLIQARISLETAFQDEVVP
jgi:hypothetical protein